MDKSFATKWAAVIYFVKVVNTTSNINTMKPIVKIIETFQRLKNEHVLTMCNAVDNVVSGSLQGSTQSWTQHQHRGYV